jgi:16S rRNA (adenine1518-N6/adenine1519-N6)-dimethyltransferase
MRLLEAASGLRLAVVMLQREVAERLCAKPATKAYGSLTLMAQWHAVVEKGFNVPPSAFSPAPKVVSTVIKLTPRPQPPVPVQDEGWLFRVIRGGFGQRRKTLVNALAAAFQHRVEPHVLRQILANVGIDAGRRGETLTLLEYARLADALREALASGREAIHV